MGWVGIQYRITRRVVEKVMFVQNPVVLPGRVILQKIPAGKRENAGQDDSLCDVPWNKDASMDEWSRFKRVIRAQ